MATESNHDGRASERGALDNASNCKQAAGTHQSTGSGSDGQRQEALVLRARRTELEERLRATRSALQSARERRDFMEEEAEQARDYGKRLAQEMARLARIAQNFPPEKAAALEKLRRLVVALEETEQQEESVRESGKAKEEELRAEIEEFTGGMDDGNREAHGIPSPPQQRSTTSDSPRQAGRPRRPTTLPEKSVDDPLTEARRREDLEVGRLDTGEARDEREARAGVGPRKAGASELQHLLDASGKQGPHKEPRRRLLEGKALLAEGLHRIEAAYEVAVAEREAVASRLSRLRLAVARRQREEDAAPGHAELLQYLLRFEELGQHALARQKQLRRCQSERSTLTLTNKVLVKQARLQETVAAGADDASKGGRGVREAYVQQLDGIVQEVEQSLANQTHLVNLVSSRRRAAEEARASVTAERKRFLTATKELAEECYRHEALKAHLTLMQR